MKGDGTPFLLPPHRPRRGPGGATVLEKVPERVRRPSPRCRVLLHEGPVNSMEYGVTTLRQEMPSLSEQDAIAVMLKAHNTGVELVIVCYLEPAEFYCETLMSKGRSTSLSADTGHWLLCGSAPSTVRRPAEPARYRQRSLPG